MRKTVLLVLLSAAVAVLLLAAGRAAPVEQMEEGGGGMGAAMEMETWTPDDCAACHEDQVAAFATNPHAVLDTEKFAGKAMGGGSCTSCHSGATHHIEEGGGEGTIFAFGEDALPAAKSGACLECHGTAHPRWKMSPHAAGGMDCTTCHSIHASEPTSHLLLDPSPYAHAGLTGLDAASAVCNECHADVFTQFGWNERHRLQEGILSCTSCHNPHAPATRVALGGFKQEACVDCHTDKGGPYVFEHGAERVEGCTACHSPHGSPNRHMLAFQNVAELCFSCHATVPGFHSRFTLESQCTNCHSSIHGSNFDPFFLK